MTVDRKWVVMALVVMWVAVTVSSVFALPPLPSSFYGTVKLGSANVPAGTQVSAWIGGVKYVETTVQTFDGDTVYALNVPGDDPTTPEVEGGVGGSTIVFRVGSQTASQTATWQSGTNVRLDLTAPPATLDHHLYLPLITRRAR